MSEAPDTDIIEPEVGALAAPEASNEQQSGEPSIEDRALTMGWTPKAQFKGDPDKWVDAETFVKRGEEFLPFLKANNKRLEKELEKVQKTLAKFQDHHTKTEARAYERAMKDLKSELAAATAAGDADAVEKIADDIADLKADVTGKPADSVKHDNDVVETWVAQNEWYRTNDVMAAAAATIAAKLESQGVTDTAKQLAEVTRQIKAEFPHKFTNPRRAEPGAVEGGGSPPRKAGKSYADLPPDAKKMCDDFVRDIKGFTREQYVKDFFQ